MSEHSLLDWAPTTFAWGFLKVNIGRVADFFMNWRSSLGMNVEGAPTRGALGDHLRRLEPLTMPPVREVLMDTDSEWVAYFNNSVKVSDPASPISYAARELGCKGLAVTCVPELTGKSGEIAIYGAVQLQMFAETMTDVLNVERSVSAMNDGRRWSFHLSGAAQEFEETERYSARRIVDRFTPQMLERYAAALGIRLFDESFYGQDGFLVSRVDAEPLVRMSLADARREIGLSDADASKSS